MYPRRCEWPGVPLFTTQNEVFHFMKDWISTGALKPCLHLKYYEHVPRGFTDQRGYGPACERDSFKTADLRSGYFDFYGCPDNCLLFEGDRRRNLPWRKEETREVAMSAERESQQSPEHVSIAVRAARISAVAIVLAALIAGGVKLWTNREKPPASESSQVAVNVETQQSQSVQNSPGSTNVQAGRDVIQAGRDVVIQSSPSAIVRAPITQMVVEARFTTTPKTGVKQPPAEVPILGHFGAHAGLEGPAGRARLDLANLIRYRQQDDGALVVINRFVLSPSSDLHQRPIEALGNYRTLDVSLNTPDFENGISMVRLVEVTMTVNGQDVWSGVLTPSVSFSKEQRFELPLDKLKSQLAGTK